VSARFLFVCFVVLLCLVSLFRVVVPCREQQHGRGRLHTEVDPFAGNNNTEVDPLAGNNTEVDPLAGNNNMEEGDYTQKNNKTFKERGTRQTHWKCHVQKGELDSLDEWMTPINGDVGMFYNKKRILKNFIQFYKCYKILNL
jgi:hypothetical protein